VYVYVCMYVCARPCACCMLTAGAAGLQDVQRNPHLVYTLLIPSTTTRMLCLSTSRTFPCLPASFPRITCTCTQLSARPITEEALPIAYQVTLDNIPGESSSENALVRLKLANRLQHAASQQCFPSSSGGGNIHCVMVLVCPANRRYVCA
jgi:hypothetical protein